MNSLRVLFVASAILFVNCQDQPSITTASGTRAPARGSFSSGDLIFEDVFDELDFETWQHENTLAGGGNWEFQAYGNNRSNSFVEDGTLHLKPTFVSEEYGEAFLTSGVMNLHGGTPADACTDPKYWGCERAGNPNNIINPIQSARLRTVHSFAFKYGTVEIRAKMPAGDWLWPALWLMPKVNAYGTWPSSGEIDLMESRGNPEFMANNVNIGNEQMGSTLHYGPRWDQNGWPRAHFTRNQSPGYNADFHTYKMVWTNESISFFVDDDTVGVINADQGFWIRGGFETTGRENPWRNSKSLMAPFDQEFYIIMNLAVGGVNYFPDGLDNRNGQKPWNNNSPTAARDFWRARNIWEPTWNRDTQDSHLQVDYVRVWAL